MNRHVLFFSTAVAASLSTSSAQAQPAIVVQGDATCPSAEMIRAALPAAQSGGGEPQTVVVDVHGDRLSLTLGEAAVRREIPADADCSVRAQSVAVVLAAWSGSLGARPTDSPDLTVAKSLPLPAPPAKSAYVLGVDGEGFYSPLWGHAYGGWLSAGRTPRHGGLGMSVVGGYQMGRDVALDGGTNQSLRFLLGVALTYHLQSRFFFASGDAGVLGTVTRVQGVGYEPNRSAAATNAGGFMGLRAGLRWGRLRLGVDARLIRVLHDETITVASTSPGVGDSAVLTAWDVQLGVGLGYRFE